MCVISKHVNARARYHAGQPPKHNPALRAFVAAQLLRAGTFGINTETAAAICTGTSRNYVKAALTVLEAEDTVLATNVLQGRCSLLAAAKTANSRAKLISSFKSATPADRAAFANAVGVGELWDTVIVPTL